MIPTYSAPCGVELYYENLTAAYRYKYLMFVERQKVERKITQTRKKIVALVQSGEGGALSLRVATVLSH